MNLEQRLREMSPAYAIPVFGIITKHPHFSTKTNKKHLLFSTVYKTQMIYN